MFIGHFGVGFSCTAGAQGVATHFLAAQFIDMLAHVCCSASSVCAFSQHPTGTPLDSAFTLPPAWQPSSCGACLSG
jgi:hypothetical protein